MTKSLSVQLHNRHCQINYCHKCTCLLWKLLINHVNMSILLIVCNQTILTEFKCWCNTYMESAIYDTVLSPLKHPPPPPSLIINDQSLNWNLVHVLNSSKYCFIMCIILKQGIMKMHETEFVYIFIWSFYKKKKLIFTFETYEQPVCTNWIKHQICRLSFFIIYESFL